MRRFPVAFLLLGVLALLAAGGAILGAFQSPAGADLAVHNGAGNTLLATTVVGQFTSPTLGKDVVSFVFTAPDEATEVARGPGGAVKARRTVSGATALGILGPLRELETYSNFTEHDGAYVRTEPASTLVPVAERRLITGTYVTTVTVTNGYATAVKLQVSATESGRHISEREDYRLNRIGSWRAH